MGINFRKRIKIAKGVYLNVGKKGVSASFGVKGLTVNSKGKMTASLPGTGLSYSTKLDSLKNSSAKESIDNGYSYLSINNSIDGIDNIDDLKELLKPTYSFKEKPYEAFKTSTTILVLLIFFISVFSSLGGEQESSNIWKPILFLALFYIYRIVRSKHQDIKINKEREGFAKKVDILNELIDDVVEKNGFINAVNIITRNLWIGETKEQLIDSIGEPIKISTKVSGEKISESYYYNQINARSYGLIVDIENDIVKGWEIK